MDYVEQLLEDQRKFQQELADQEEAFLREQWQKSGLPLKDWLRVTVYNPGDTVFQYDEATNTYSAHSTATIRAKTLAEIEEYDRMMAERTPAQIEQHTNLIASIEDSRKIQGL